MLFAHPKGQPFGCPFCSTTVACGLFSLSLSRRAKKLPPEVFLYALSNPFGCNFVPIKRRDSIRASAGAWSLAVTTLHRSVALCRSSFESLRMQFVPIKNDGLRPSFFIGPPEGIRTPDLQNRNLLRYPTAPRTEIFYLRKQIYTKTDKMSRQAGCAYYTPCPDFLLNLFDNLA